MRTAIGMLLVMAISAAALLTAIMAYNSFWYEGFIVFAFFMFLSMAAWYAVVVGSLLLARRFLKPR
jgi:hypothetical protein